MCGLVGIFDSRGTSQINKKLLNDMNEAQFHRGPDEGGLYLSSGIGLGHRRLSIIDLSSGQQPLFNEDKSVVVVYNGEIYNFKELVSELTSRGHEFNTHCDTEVIVHAWEEWGVDCVQRFRGMFAFALWDSNSSKLFLARDRIGIKPLYYSLLPTGHLIFSSELKAIKIHPEFNHEMDSYSIEDYFSFGYVPEPKTIYKNTYKLNPGHFILMERGSTSVKQIEYWDVPFKDNGITSENQIMEETIDRLKEAVDIRLIAEVPLGAFLSGGVDSSAIVALMAELNSTDRVNTCSIAFGDAKYNESEYAEKIAKKYRTNHYVETVSSDHFELIDKLSGIYDEPYADSSALPTYMVCELAKKNVTVVLSGDGGDENFAGYRRYKWHMNEEIFRRSIPSVIRKPVFKTLGKIYPKLDWAPKIFRAKTTFQAIGMDSFESYLHSVSFMPETIRNQIYSEQYKKQLAGYTSLEVFKNHANNSPTDHPLSLIQYLDFKTYLPGDILTKVDRASMANSLEVRVPILDHKYVEWVSGINPSLKLNNGEGKYIFKKSLETRLPNDILYRKKMGFAVPLSSWFRGPLKETISNILNDGELHDSGLFNPDILRKIGKEHISGIGEHSASIWALLMFQKFLRQQ